MREKEKAEDYRFIPDPDLPVIKLTKQEVSLISRNLPETPSQKLEKLIKKHKISKKQAQILYKNLELVEFFEQITRKLPSEFALHWITIELLRVLHYNKKSLDSPEISINPEHFTELLNAVKSNQITELKAKQILNSFIPKSYSIKNKLKKESKISEKQTQEIIESVLKNNQKAVSDFKKGESSALNFLIGQVMKHSDKKADYKIVRKIIEKKLNYLSL
jgi:aspartyl-tRNA(Asn)/glutamyl-tRNA(Gln) amidotransferase subunit B